MNWATLIRGRWLKQWLSEQVQRSSRHAANARNYPGAIIDCDAIIRGNVVLHDGVNLRKGVSVTGNVEIGRGTFCNGPASIRAPKSKITIGSFCSLASYCALTTGDHPITKPSTYHTNTGKYGAYFRNVAISESPINVGCDVWIARGCTILKGVNIGHGAIVAAGAVVTSDIPPYAIYGGIPARLIRHRFSETTIDWLLSIQWWNWSEEQLQARTEFFSTDLAELGIEQLLQLESKLGIQRCDPTI
jgi:virginiamycin A acetyltransferase